MESGIGAAILGGTTSHDENDEAPRAVPRRQRRATGRWVARQERKSSRKHMRGQREALYRQENLLAQQAVLASDDPKLAAMKSNVANDLLIRGQRAGLTDDGA